MSQLLKLEIVNGKARHKIIDPANDSFTFKEITIGTVTLTEETVAGLSYEALQDVKAELEAAIAALTVSAADDLVDALTIVDAQLASLDTRLDTAEAALVAILSNNPDQWTQVVSGVSKSAFTVTGFSFDASHTVLDIEVFINGRRLVQCVVGDFSTGSYRKTSTTAIELSQLVPVAAEVVVWRQGTSSAGSGSGGGSSGETVDLTAITQNPSPSVAGGQALGTTTKPWSGLYMKDTVTAQAYLVRIVNGTFEIVEVPE